MCDGHRVLPNVCENIAQTATIHRSMLEFVKAERWQKDSKSFESKTVRDNGTIASGFTHVNPSHPSQTVLQKELTWTTRWKERCNNLDCDSASCEVERTSSQNIWVFDLASKFSYNMHYNKTCITTRQLLQYVNVNSAWYPTQGLFILWNV